MTRHLTVSRRPSAKKMAAPRDKSTDRGRPRETALVVAVQTSGATLNDVEESLAELDLLARTAGAQVDERIIQARDKPHVRTYLGSGKVEEIAQIVKAKEIDTVFFDDELSPSQLRNLEEMIDCKILDRTALILDIFAQRAHSAEGKLQVELAQLNYRLPRLRGRGVAMSRLGAGIGTRGPGETKLEADRRRIEQRIDKLKGDLSRVSQSRDIQRKSRRKRSTPTITLVGYTNAGKSTLLNALTNANVLAEDMLFATLDSTTRQLFLPSKREVVLTDTVGFIRKLPHQLVNAFRSTLDEVRDADMLLHVTDASSDEREAQSEAVLHVLDEIGASDTPRLDVLNKADLLPEDEAGRLSKRHPGAILASAVTGAGIDELRHALDGMLGRIAAGVEF